MMKLVATVLDGPDAPALARFYRDLLGWPITVDSPGYRHPTWPASPGDQRAMVHLDIEVDDLATAGARAESLGATPADHQPQDHVRVYLDPAGHPFCLFTRT